MSMCLQAAIERVFGVPFHLLFESFEPEPVASGSIGQVYRARLTPKGARNTGIDAGMFSYLFIYDKVWPILTGRTSSTQYTADTVRTQFDQGSV